ncbi:hypothetical protein HHI36_017159, partial [Cryptolaemus montrouzieri]
RTETNQPKNPTENLQVIEEPRYKFESFRIESTQNLYQRRLDEKFMDTEGLTLNEIYNNIKDSLKKDTQEAIGIQEVKRSNKIWWNEEISDSIDMKKKKYITWLHLNRDKFLHENKAAKNEVRSLIKTEKNNSLDQHCQQIETLIG